MPQERILVVDDEAAVRGVVAAVLERQGYWVASTDGAEQALTRLKEDPAYDLVMSDVMMPRIDGLSLLDHIGVDHPGTPVVIFTAVQDLQVATNAFRRGAVDYLVKPFERAELLSVVGRAVEHGRLQHQRRAYHENLEEIVAARTSKLRATMQDLERSYDITLEAMGDALDLRDAETQGHSRRVTAYAIALAREMELNGDELRVISRGAFLHDLGKISTPDCVLLKPGKLDKRETEIMREHCWRGYEMVRKIPFLREASEIVYSHQERFDGTGYPRGLSGEEIPLGARIFAVADTLDAITSDRPYRKRQPFAAASAEIVKGAGTQFDPAVVEIFLRVPVSRWVDLRAKIMQTSQIGLLSTLSQPDLCA